MGKVFGVGLALLLCWSSASAEENRRTLGAADTPLKTHDDVMAAMVKLLDDAAIVLEGVKDEATAKAAVPKVDKLAERAREIAKKGKELGEPKGDEGKKLQEKYAPQFQKVTQRFQAAAVKAAPHIGANAELKDAFEKFGKAFQG